MKPLSTESQLWLSHTIHSNTVISCSYYCVSCGISQSSQLAEPLWTDPGIESGNSVQELISTLKKEREKKVGVWMVEQSPQNSFKRGKNYQWKFYREGGIFTENAVFFSLLLNSDMCTPQVHRTQPFLSSEGLYADPHHPAMEGREG